MRRAFGLALLLLAAAHALLSGAALHTSWREVAGLDPVSTYAGLPFLILAFPWVFLVGLLPNAFAQLIGMAGGVVMNFILICLAARRIAGGKGRKPSASA